MNARTDIQTIFGADGKPAFVVIPYAEFQRMSGGMAAGSIPHAVVSAEVDGASAIKAWREYLHLTQAEVAARLGVTQAAFAQMESATRPRKATLQKVADAMGLTLEQVAR